jgi:hypothetical protein
LNNKYFITKDEKNIKLSETPISWHANYPKYKLNSVKETWHKQTSIDFIKSYTPDKLRWLDIWDYPWTEFRDNRNFFQKYYHGHQNIIMYLPKVIPKYLKELIKKI